MWLRTRETNGLPSRITAVIAVVLLSSLWGGAAHATLSIDLIWSATTGTGETGSTRIDAQPGDRLTLDVFLNIEQPGVLEYSVTVIFDDDLKDELDLVSTEEFEHVADVNCTPFPECFTNFGPELMNANQGIESETESDDTTAGSAVGFEAIQLGDVGPSDVTILIGRIVFDVTENLVGDGVDVDASFFVDGLDGVLFDDLSAILPPDLPDPGFEPGFAPEPTPGLLGLASLVTLAGLRRRRARQSTGWV